MKEQIKDICFFMIIGQTLLHFQSGKKYEKICRMILDLLILVGIVGIVLNLLQSVGIRKGELMAEGGAVSDMQHSMEEALSKQLDIEMDETDFLQGFSAEDLLEKYTLEEMKSRYNYLALGYGMEIEKIERNGENLAVYVRRNGEMDETETTGEKPEYFREEGDIGDFDEGKESSVGQVEISDIHVEEIRIEEGDMDEEGEIDRGEGKDGEGDKAVEEGRTKEEDKTGEGNKAREEDGMGEGETEEGAEQAALEAFRTELADIFLMEKDRLEVILVG